MMKNSFRLLITVLFLFTGGYCYGQIFVPSSSAPTETSYIVGEEYDTFIECARWRSRDGIDYYTWPYTINLPKGVETWLANSKLGTFNYRNLQDIYIYIPDFHEDPDIPDRTYVPDWDEAVEYLDEYLRGSGDYKVNAKIRLGNRDNQPKNRRNLVMVRDGVYIVLFNIKEKNFEHFRETVESFQRIY